jgi:hypothetical protein
MSATMILAVAIHDGRATVTTLPPNSLQLSVHGNIGDPVFIKAVIEMDGDKLERDRRALTGFIDAVTVMRPTDDIREIVQAAIGILLQAKKK